MFSGIIADLGTIVERSPRGNGCTLLIECGFPIGGADGIQLGDSIACNGVCLTAESLQPPNRFTVAAGKETLDCTTFGSLQTGDRLHMERALQVNARLDGHIVSGHVDGVGTVVSTTAEKESWVVWIEAPEALARVATAVPAVSSWSGGSVETAVGGATDAWSMGERCLSLLRIPLSLAFLLGDARTAGADAEADAGADAANAADAADDDDARSQGFSAQQSPNHSSVVGTLLRPTQNVW